MHGRISKKLKVGIEKKDVDYQLTQILDNINLKKLEKKHKKLGVIADVDGDLFEEENNEGGYQISNDDGAVYATDVTHEIIPEQKNVQRREGGRLRGSSS